MQLADAVVLVTGASRGLGAATARELDDRGAVVVAAGRDRGALDRVPAGLRLVADLAERDAATSLVGRVLQHYGRLDGVVANAGVGWAGPFAEMPEDRLASLVDVNVRAPLLLARAALPPLLERPQAGIVLVGSIAGHVGVPGEAAYSATKAALAVFADALGDELVGTGVSVSTVSPGVVDTEFFTTRGAYDRRFPRPRSAERVARVVVDSLESGRPRRLEPRWLTIPARLAGAAPGTYRRLARRFG
ncbi:short-subunit dehydrogenase [Motilibacter peucedani]|uniref:Short-subunit dehydrogenase n=1 Tax=Motilibacter peucedani TaxID=598650 RepID=A0A420XJT2_9ACTN|nr:short-subunit dehydrogenase [Motilibacter peucedani]